MHRRELVALIDREWMCQLLEDVGGRVQRIELLLDSIDLRTTDGNAILRGTNWEVSEHHIAVWETGESQPLTDASHYARFKDGDLQIRGGNLSIHTGEAGAHMTMDGSGLIGYSAAAVETLHLDWTSGNLWAMKGGFGGTEGAPLIVLNEDGTATIAGWQILAASIKDAAGVVGMSSAVTVGDDIRFWAGHAVPASAPFQVTEAGALVASSATITGSITATSGAIGGWVITAAALADAAGTVGMSSAVTGGDDIRFWAGNVTPASAPFRVTEAGVLTASSGTIGGWVLAAASLADVAGLVGMSSAVTGGDDIRFWAGHVTPGSAPFRVTEAGVLTATSGTIGGWALAATILTGGNAILDSAGILSLGTGNDIVILDAADATYRLAIGNATYASAPFRVTKAGVLTAAGASITGTISSTVFSSGVSGWQITAAGDAEFNNLVARGSFTTAIFVKNLISAVAGNLIVAKSSGVLDANYAVSGTMTIKSPPGGGWLFATGDIVRLKDYEGGASSFDTWVTVTQTGTENVYTTVLLAGTSPHTYNEGLAVVDYGASGQGIIQLSADGTNAPWMSIATHAGAPQTTLTEKVRVGLLTGITDPLFGALSGYGIWTDSGYFTGKIKSVSGELGGWVLDATTLADAAGVVGLSSAVTGGDDIRFWAGHATPASAPFRVTEAGALVASSATITGSITATSGDLGTMNVSGTLTVGGTGNLVVTNRFVVDATSMTFENNIAGPQWKDVSGAIKGAMYMTPANVLRIEMNLPVGGEPGDIAIIPIGAGSAVKLYSEGLHIASFLTGGIQFYRNVVINNLLGTGSALSVNTSGAAAILRCLEARRVGINCTPGAAELQLTGIEDAISLDIYPFATQTWDMLYLRDYSNALQFSVGVPWVDTILTGDTSANNFQAANWEAQTFVADETGYITVVKVKLYRVGDPQDVTVSIRATSAGLPTGIDLSSATVDCTGITPATVGEWVTFTLACPVLVIGGTTYAIVIRAPSGSTPYNYCNWRCSGTSIYTGGSRIYSTNSGVTWTAYTPQDYVFNLTFAGGEINYKNILQPVRGGVTYQGWVYVPLPTAIVGNGFSLTAYSTTGPTALTVSSTWAGVPTYAKAIVLDVICKDSAAAPTLYFQMASSNTGTMANIAVRPQVSNYYNDNGGILPVVNDTVYWRCVASGAGTMSVYAAVTGYFI